jgi:hypothetical protein
MSFVSTTTMIVVAVLSILCCLMFMPVQGQDDLQESPPSLSSLSSDERGMVESADASAKTPHDSRRSSIPLTVSKIRTCEDFPHLKVECCPTCHHFYPHYEISVIDLPNGGRAWVCDTVKWAIYSEQHRELTGVGACFSLRVRLIFVKCVEFAWRMRIIQGKAWRNLPRVRHQESDSQSSFPMRW